MNIVLLYSDVGQSSTLPDDVKFSPERYACLKSVRDSLLSLGHNVIDVPAIGGMFSTLKKLRGNVDLVFNLTDEGYECDPQLEPRIPAVLDTLGIPYTGSDGICLGNCLNKIRTKQLLSARGISTPNYKVFNRGIDGVANVMGLRFPMIVKPAKADGSSGIYEDSVVNNEEDLAKSVNRIIEEHDQPALVEEFIRGREISVGILGNEELTVLPLSEIIFELPDEKWNFLPYEAKWQQESEYYLKTTPKCPADVNPELKEKIVQTAVNTYKLMDVKGYARVDFRVDNDENPYVIDVNPNPDLSSDAGLARMAKAEGMSYEGLVAHIVSLGPCAEQTDTTETTRIPIVSIPYPPIQQGLLLQNRPWALSQESEKPAE